MGWVTFSPSERLRYPFCRYLLKRKHVRCLITAWHLTVFSDQSDTVLLFFFFVCLFLYIFMLAIWSGNMMGKKKQNQAVLQAFSTAFNIRYRKCCAHFFPPLFICVYFSLALFGLTQSTETSSLPSELKKKKKSLSNVKNVNHLTLLQHRAIVNLRLCTSQHFSALRFILFYFFTLWGIVALSFFKVSEYALL